jgi:phosphate acetyltransferase
MRKAKGKDLTMDAALERMRQPHYYGAMLVKEDKADGLISGYNSQTKPYYPAFEIITVKEGISRVSGVFIMVNKNDDKYYFFSDCAININPGSEQLAEIALTTAGTCVSIGVKPKVAMLSFSTRGSAQHEMVDKVRNAAAIVKEKDKDLIVEGEIQLDAAIVPEVCRKKCADSRLEGDANVLIFPDLNAGNIGYKLVERLGHYRAIGPVMQGLNKPVNDLSRGSSIEDIAALAAVTVLQGL